MKKLLILIFGPLNIFPLFFLQLFLFGNYSIYDIGHLQNIPLILQGSSDWGGSNQYATFITLYISLGLSATYYLYLCLKNKYDYPILKLVKFGLFYLSFHISCFAFSSILFFLHPDGRNMTLLFTFIYSITFFIILWIVKNRKSWKHTLIAPLFIYLFVFIAWDGSSPKAGQILKCGEDPEWNPRSKKHQVVLYWHKFADTFFSIFLLDNDR